MTAELKSVNLTRLDREKVLDLYRRMLLIREFEEQAQDLYSRTLIPGILHVSIGQEAVPVGVCAALRESDYITSTHRGHGHCLAKGADAGRMFAELFGKLDGYCRGKGGSMHIANRDVGNLGANAIVGGSIPIATGAALSAKLRKTGQVVVCFFGDGALNQGVFFESMNFASIWKLPVIYVCENNQYGEYTPIARVTAGNILLRGEAFEIPSVRADGMDVEGVYDTTREAAESARSGEGPSFIVFETYRFCGHGMSDRDRAYRTREEEQQWQQNCDPVARLRERLIKTGQATRTELDGIHDEAKREISAGVDFGSRAAYPDPDEVAKHVFAE
jgi:pyruvate dehydrogenase E1 component alpha subunit